MMGEFGVWEKKKKTAHVVHGFRRNSNSIKAKRLRSTDERKAHALEKHLWECQPEKDHLEDPD